MTDWSYIGKGVCYVGLKDGTEGLRDVGNVDSLVFSADEDKKELVNFRIAGGGLYNSLSRISNVTMTMNMRDFSAENIGVAMRGDANAFTAGAVTDEEQVAYSDSLTTTTYMLDTGETVVVTMKDGDDASAWQASTAYDGDYVIPTTPNTYYYKATTAGTSAASPEPTWPTTEGGTVVDGTVTWTCMGLITRTDYTAVNAGIVWSPTSQVEAGSTCKVDYTKDAGKAVEALVNSASEYKMVFVGLNEAQSSKPVNITVHRAKFGAGQNLGFIEDDFGAIEIVGDVLADSTITTAGISQYFKANIAS